MKKERVQYVDFYRGIGIILMIMAHIGFGKTFDHFIHAFHMPMFFFVSGYFFRCDDAKTFFLRKIKTLLFPYLFYSALNAFLWNSLFHEITAAGYFKMLLRMNNSDFVAAALWFLPALFLADTLYWLIRRSIKKPLFVTLASAGIALTGNLAHLAFPDPCPFAIDAAAVGVGIIHVGNQLHYGTLHSQKILNLSPLQTLVSGAIFSVLIMHNSPVNMRTGVYGFIPLFWINSIGSSIVLWNAARLFYSFCNNHGAFLSKSCYKIKMVGERSLTSLCMNQMAIYLFSGIIPILGTVEVFKLARNLLVLVFVITSLYIISCFIDVLCKLIQLKLFTRE